MLKSISILESTNDYIILKIPRAMLSERKELTESEALMLCEKAEQEYYARKTKAFPLLKDLRWVSEYLEVGFPNILAS